MMLMMPTEYEFIVRYRDGDGIKETRANVAHLLTAEDCIDEIEVYGWFEDPETGDADKVLIRRLKVTESNEYWEKPWIDNYYAERG